MIREGQQIMLQSDDGLILVGTVSEYDPDEMLAIVTDTGDEWELTPSDNGDFEDEHGNEWLVTNPSTRSNPCLPCIGLNPSEPFLPEGWCFDGQTEDKTGLTLAEAAKLSPQFASEIRKHCKTVPGCKPHKIRVRLNPAQEDEVKEYALKRWGTLSWKGPKDREITWTEFAARIKAAGGPGAKETAKALRDMPGLVRDFALPMNPRGRKGRKNPKDKRKRARNVRDLVAKALK